MHLGKTQNSFDMNHFIRYITTPSGGQYNQVAYLAELFNNQKEGFFIEAGKKFSIIFFN